MAFFVTFFVSLKRSLFFYQIRKPRAFLEKLSIKVLADVAYWVGCHLAN